MKVYILRKNLKANNPNKIEYNKVNMLRKTVIQTLDFECEKTASLAMCSRSGTESVGFRNTNSFHFLQVITIILLKNLNK